MTPQDISCELRAEIKERLHKIGSDINKVDHPDYYVLPLCHLDWVVLNIPFGDRIRNFVVTPTVKFKQLFFNRQYLKAVAENPDLFGSGEAEDVLKALKNTDANLFPDNFTLQDSKEYLKSENMAYVMEISGGTLGEKVLRIDLFHDIKTNGDFKTGLFHSLKHFTLEDYDSISKDIGGLELPFWELILLLITKNFFSDPVLDNEKHRWTSVHEYGGKYAVGGYIPKTGYLYIFNTIIVKKQRKLSSFEKTIIK